MNKKNSFVTTTRYILLCCAVFLCSTVMAQKITFSGKNVPFEQAIEAIRQQTDYTVFGQKKEFAQAKRISIQAVNMDIRTFVAEISKFEPFQYSIDNKVIAFSKPATKAATRSSEEVQRDQRIILGEVRRKDNNQPIENATVRIKNTAYQSATNVDGFFALTYDATVKSPALLVSYIGMKDIELSGDVLQKKPVIALLEEVEQTIEDVVVTGIFTRRKESFSGASSTYSADQLKMVSGTNVLQSLNILDPSFNIVTNNQLGSDPNQELDIEIRGKTSVAGLDEAYGSNPNQPLFILDGFETTMQRIRDISMDRIGSITILKDATATAMYGSKGANGVVVVETVKPKPGQLGVSYNLRSNIQVADLTDYNLMNAAEKLQFEKLSHYYGRLDDQGNIVSTGSDNEALYQERLKEVRRGVDSYWMNEPLRTGVSQSHDLSIYGGDPNFQYSVGLTKSITQGVMQKSGNDVTDGVVTLTYRNGNVSFTNMLNARTFKAENAPVSFTQFAYANPYLRKYNEQGGIDKILDHNKRNDTESYNPLYDFNNNNINTQDNQQIINNFSMDWTIRNGLNFRLNFGLSQFRNQSLLFRSPHNTQFIGTAMEQRGTYRERDEKVLRYNSLATITYGKVWNLQSVNLVAGASMNNAQTSFSTFDVEGFMDDKIVNPSLAFGYKDGALPDYGDLHRREAGFLLNANYGYDNRYIFDGNLRIDGSSIYGSNKNSTAIWSVGGYWNIGREKFLESAQTWLESFRLRVSYGNLGNQNFNDYIALQIYQYSKANSNPFGPGLIVGNHGNPNLQWQKTLNQNYGFDMAAFSDRLRLTFNYYVKNTDPLLVYITTPSSSGRTQRIQNLGALETKGMEADINFAPIMRGDFIWRVAALVGTNKSLYRKIGNTLDEYNQTNRSKNLQRFYDGASPDDLWAVRSLGIDPATGREMFLKLTGEETFVHDYADEVKLGNSRPLYDGNLSTSIFYKGFQLFASFRYQLGGQEFMSTLYQKVENISAGQIKYNQDKRALYDRWQKPGDRASFKSISETSYTPMSSRFIQDNDIFTLQSVSLNYQSSTLRWLPKIGAKSLRVGVNSNDLMYLSTIKNERGIDYPFARDITFNLGISF